MQTVDPLNSFLGSNALFILLWRCDFSYTFSALSHRTYFLPFRLSFPFNQPGDGVADVNQISANELVMRKTKLVLAKIEPQKVYY